jgi:propionyl-CoA carboxylase alpha chain
VLTEQPRFGEPEPLPEPGSLLAPMPGTVVRVAAAGERVAAGDPVVVIEAMKMEHVIRAPAAGVVGEACVAAGQVVDTGTTLARVDPDAAAGPDGAGGQGQAGKEGEGAGA